MYSFSDLRIVSLILEYAKLHHFFTKSCLYEALLNMSKLQNIKDIRCSSNGRCTKNCNKGRIKFYCLIFTSGKSVPIIKDLRS